MTIAQPETNKRFPAGELIQGKYRLVKLIGSGGIAEVWEAVNVDLQIPVAVKVCKPNASDETTASRLVQEARAAARLSHPAIVRIYDTGLTDSGEPFIVMERLRGKTLREEFDDREEVDIVFVVQVMIGVLDALSFAHQNGIIHRDVKPDNIFLAELESGKVQPKLLDFGIVKLEGYDSQLTKTGTTLGSPAYMAPEQASGALDLDQRADVWGACVVLFEAITDEMPFEAPNYNALMHKILSDPVPDLRALLVEQHLSGPFADSIAVIVQKGLTKERDQRWQSAKELSQVLAAALSGHGQRVSFMNERMSSAYQIARPTRDSHDPAVTLSQASAIYNISDRPKPRGRLGRLSVWVALIMLLIGVTTVLFVLNLRNEPTATADAVSSNNDGQATPQANAAGGRGSDNAALPTVLSAHSNDPHHQPEGAPQTHESPAVLGQKDGMAVREGTTGRTSKSGSRASSPAQPSNGPDVAFALTTTAPPVRPRAPTRTARFPSANSDNSSRPTQKEAPAAATTGSLPHDLGLKEAY